MLVELLDQYTDVYPRSVSGARGRVRMRREMPQVEPEIFIDWDKTHWRYHNETDGWTYEHHFRPVDISVPSDPDPSLMETILDDASDQLDAERCPECGGFHPAESDYLDTLMQSQEAALASDAFLTITLSPRQEGEFVVFEPEVFSAALNPTARDMIAMQLVSMAAQLYQDSILARAQGLEDQQ